MDKWTPLELSPEKIKETVDIGGVKVELLVSPYDVPEAMRVRYVSELKRLVIEFKYIDADEPIDAQNDDQHLTLYIGRNSKRLFKVEIDVDGLSSKEISERTMTAIDRLINKSKSISFLDNYKLARRAVHNSRNQLMRANV